MIINSFQGKYRFLSNFYPVRVYLDDDPAYLSVEHAYQAAKTNDQSERRFIWSSPSPGEAKRRGRQITIRPDWDQVKLSIMEGLLRQKFSQEPFRSWLLLTGDNELVEGNTWGDRFWGVCHGQGQNHLGKLLMEIRADIRIAQG